MTTPERQLRVGGVSLHVRDVGTGPPLLLINGLGAHTAMWAPVERRLPDIRLISYDSPGVGDSPATLPPLSIPRLANLLAELLDHLGLGRVDVLGYSFGGAVAQQFAFRHADRVRRLVLASTTPGLGGALGEWQSLAHAYNPLRYYSQGYYERSIGKMAGGQARHDDAFRRRHGAERSAKRPHPTSYYSQIAALSTWSSLPWLHRVDAPTLVLTGDDDPLVPPANSVLLASLLRQARLFVLPGEGHLLLFDDHGAAHPAVRDFLLSPSVEESSTWREAESVDPQRATVAVAERGMRPLPWGLVNAALRGGLMHRAR